MAYLIVTGLALTFGVAAGVIGFLSVTAALLLALRASSRIDEPRDEVTLGGPLRPPVDRYHTTAGGGYTAGGGGGAFSSGGFSGGGGSFGGGGASGSW